jgi:NAD(P)H dehydrogenase (quinone)
MYAITGITGRVGGALARSLLAVLDGFNEGWIEFSDNGRSAVKGTTTLDSVIAELVEASRAKAAA